MVHVAEGHIVERTRQANKKTEDVIGKQFKAKTRHENKKSDQATSKQHKAPTRSVFEEGCVCYVLAWSVWERGLLPHSF